MEKKFRIDFDESNVLESVTYTLVSEFNLKPNVLRADIGGDGHGFMLLSLVGEKDDMICGIEHIRGQGFKVKELSGHIFHDYDRCWSCGACETVEVRLNTGTCIACGSCINACSVKAIQLEL